MHIYSKAVFNILITPFEEGGNFWFRPVLVLEYIDFFLKLPFDSKDFVTYVTRKMSS